MYYYSFKAYFISTGFNMTLLNVVVPTAVNTFNTLPRKKGHKKNISISINTIENCLDITLQSDIQLDPINYLRACQYFSKALSLQPGMGSYIIDGRLLVQ